MKNFVVILLYFFTHLYSFSSPLKDFTIDKCKEYDIPSDIAIAIIEVEPGWQNIRGVSGDIGIFQLNPVYISYFEKKFWNGEKKFNPWNPYHNIEVGLKYLKWLYIHFNSWEKAIMAYNIGPRAVTNNYKVHQGNRYFVKVVKVLNRL